MLELFLQSQGYGSLSFNPFYILSWKKSWVISIPLFTSYRYIAMLHGIKLSIVLNFTSLLKNVLSISIIRGLFILQNKAAVKNANGGEVDNLKHLRQLVEDRSKNNALPVGEVLKPVKSFDMSVTATVIALAGLIKQCRQTMNLIYLIFGKFKSLITKRGSLPIGSPCSSMAQILIKR